MSRILLFLILFTSSHSWGAKTTDGLILDKYLGRWHEIYSVANSFQKDCYNVTADYSLNDDGTIKVINTCRNESGFVKKEVEGEAVLQSFKQRYLKVYFYRPFGLNLWGGDYYIMALEKNYSWAIVGTPNHKYGWVLSRKTKLSSKDLKTIQSEAERLGFNWSNFKKTSTKTVLPK